MSATRLLPLLSFALFLLGCGGGPGDLCTSHGDCRSGLLCARSIGSRGICTYPPSATADASADRSRSDRGSADGTALDARALDATPLEARPAEAGPAEAGPAEAGPAEAGPGDARVE